MRRHHPRLLLACAMVLSACSSQDRTRLAVTVYSDLSVPTEIDTLRIYVQGPTGTNQVDYALAAQETAGKYVLPVQTILVPQGSKSDSFTVIASGIRDRQEVITRSARLPFLPGEARELIIFLNRDCYQRTCAADRTCVAGDCISNLLNSKDLPVYTTNKAGQALSPDASSSADSAGADTTVPEGSDARGRLDGWTDGRRDEAGMPADTQSLAVDAEEPSRNPPADAPLAATDTVPVRWPDGGAIISGPDSASPDGNPSVDRVPVFDAEFPNDTPQGIPDAALPDTRPASPDTPVDVPCPAGCDPGAKRCGQSGIQICGLLSNGCTAWGSDQPCGTHQTCTGEAPTAACTCNASGSSKCPLPGSNTGNFCEGSDTLQSCMRDSDGCFYLGAPVTCQTSKPCTGDDGSASCSCGAVAAPCTTTVGTFCNAGNTQVFSCAYDSATSCMVTTPSTTCPTGKPCVQTGPAAAECTCPTVAECDSASEMNRGYCASNTAITCSADANNCQQVSKLGCQSNQTCQVSGNSSSCACINATCLTPGGATFSHQACDTDARVLTCGTVNACPGITATNECATGTVCRASGENAQCLPTFGLYDELAGSGQRYSNMLIGYPVTVSTAGRLAKVGLFVKSLPATGTPSVKMGVYSGADNSLLAAMESILSVGRNELTPSSAVSLATGTYWVFTLFSMDGVSVAQTSPNVPRRSQVWVSSNPLPASMSGTGSESGPPSNYYLIVSP